MSSPAKKVVLRAFGGRLVSQPFEWPADKIGQDIYLMLDMEKPSIKFRSNSSIKEYTSTPKKARFEFSGGFDSRGDMPAVYILVDVS